MTKPWLSKGPIKSIKVKQKTLSFTILSKDPVKISIYKTYSNVLNKLKTKTKNEYCRKQFQLCKDKIAHCLFVQIEVYSLSNFQITQVV